MASLQQLKGETNGEKTGNVVLLNLPKRLRGLADFLSGELPPVISPGNFPLWFLPWPWKPATTDEEISFRQASDLSVDSRV